MAKLMSEPKSESLVSRPHCPVPTMQKSFAATPDRGAIKRDKPMSPAGKEARSPEAIIPAAAEDQSFRGIYAIELFILGKLSSCENFFAKRFTLMPTGCFFL